MVRRRLAAAAALLAVAAVVIMLGYLVMDDPRRVLLSAGLLACSGFAATTALTRSGSTRALGFVTAAIALLASLATLVTIGRLWADLAILALAAGAIVGMRQALRPHVRLRSVAPPHRPALIWNAKSGGGKAVSSGLVDDAERRGFTTVEVTPGCDSAAIANDLVDAGADALAAAGGDGTQAAIAAVAAARGVPFACIPAGTRNHFALDLGVDRDDLVGALDAFVDGGERTVDLAEVNGRVFVNNCSLGIYAEAVQQRGYRDAKIRTILSTAARTLTPTGSQTATLSWSDPSHGQGRGAAVILVSNNAYRFGRGFGSGTRPRMDTGLLGVALVHTPGTAPAAPAESSEPRGTPSVASTLAATPSTATWSTSAFTVDNDCPVNIGVDGEALTLEPPIAFTMRPGALRVRISPRHPGASPSAFQPDSIGGTALLLLRLATGRPVPELR